MGEDVFGGKEPFLDALAHPALKKDRLAGFRALDEELEVLRVAGTDLEDVRRGGDMLDIALAENLGNDLQPGLAAGEFEQAEPLLAETLEFIRRGAGFVSAAAQDFRPGGLHLAGGAEELLLALDRARAGHHGEMPTADFHAIHIDHGVGGMRFAAGEFEAFLHAQDTLHLRKGREGFEVLVCALIADRRNDGLCGTVNGSGFVAELGNLGDDFLDEGFGGVRAKDDDHVFRFARFVCGPSVTAPSA